MQDWRGLDAHYPQREGVLVASRDDPFFAHRHLYFLPSLSLLLSFFI